MIVPLGPAGPVEFCNEPPMIPIPNEFRSRPDPRYSLVPQSYVNGNSAGMPNDPYPIWKRTGTFVARAPVWSHNVTVTFAFGATAAWAIVHRSKVISAAYPGGFNAEFKFARSSSTESDVADASSGAVNRSWTTVLLNDAGVLPGAILPATVNVACPVAPVVAFTGVTVMLFVSVNAGATRTPLAAVPS